MMTIFYGKSKHRANNAEVSTEGESMGRKGNPALAAAEKFCRT